MAKLQVFAAPSAAEKNEYKFYNQCNGVYNDCV